MAWNSTCFGQFFCPSSGVYSLYTQQWYMAYRFVDSFRAGPGWNTLLSWSCSKAVYKPVWHITLLSVQWINSWWWTEELSETCRVSWQNKFVKLVHLVGFIIKTFVTMHGHMSRCTVTCHDARSHERKRVIPIYIANINRRCNAIHPSELQDVRTKDGIICWRYFSMDSRSGKTSSPGLNVSLKFLAYSNNLILCEIANANSRSQISL